MSKWDDRFLDLAGHVATWSKDPSTKVGAVLVDDLRRVLSVGYNGFPRRVEDADERYQNRDRKYPMTVHAEVNAVLNSVASTEGATVYCTPPPCSTCAGVLIQAGVCRVVARAPQPKHAARWGESWGVTATMFAEAGVEVEVVGE